MLTNRRGGEATATYPELSGPAQALAPRSVVLDGEVVSFNEKGQTSFQRLQRRMHVIRPPARLLAETPVAFVAFDVLCVDGDLVVDRPQRERRRILDSFGVKGPAWHRRLKEAVTGVSDIGATNAITILRGMSPGTTR